MIDKFQVNDSRSIAKVICRQAGKGEPSYPLDIFDETIEEADAAFEIRSCSRDEDAIQDCNHVPWEADEPPTSSAYYRNYVYIPKIPHYLSVICNGELL